MENEFKLSVHFAFRILDNMAKLGIKFLEGFLSHYNVLVSDYAILVIYREILRGVVVNVVELLRYNLPLLMMINKTLLTFPS